jgi:hypothetical protein
MKNLLVWVFGLIGLVAVAGGGFLMLKDGGLATELGSRDAKLQQTLDPEGLLKAWGEKVDELAERPVSLNDLREPSMVGAAVQKLPQPKEVADAISDGASAVGRQVDRILGRDGKPVEPEPTDDK